MSTEAKDNINYALILALNDRILALSDRLKALEMRVKELETFCGPMVDVQAELYDPKKHGSLT